jgi:hypothetical protein
MEKASDYLNDAPFQNDPLHSVTEESQAFAGWMTIMESRLELERTRRSPRSEQVDEEVARLVAAADTQIESLLDGPGIAKFEHRYRRNTRILLWLFWRLRLEKIANDLIDDPKEAAQRRSERLSLAKRIFAMAGKLWDDDPSALDEFEKVG